MKHDGAYNSFLDSIGNHDRVHAGKDEMSKGGETMADLKRCPFCGGEARISHYGPFVTRTSKVECASCGACTKYFLISEEYSSDQMAAEAWNRRTEDDAR